MKNKFFNLLLVLFLVSLTACVKEDKNLKKAVKILPAQTEIIVTPVAAKKYPGLQIPAASSVQLNARRDEIPQPAAPSGLILNVHSIKSARSIYDGKTRRYADLDRRYLLVKVSVTNHAGLNHLAHPRNFLVFDSKGQSYDYDFATYDLDREFSSALLSSGEKAEGWLAFQLPKGLTPAKIIYAGSYADQAEYLVKNIN